jgi:dihydroflavonol-4-reductase
MAEEAAWDFLKGLPEDERFELVVINPLFLIGPTFIPVDF